MAIGTRLPDDHKSLPAALGPEFLLEGLSTKRCEALQAPNFLRATEAEGCQRHVANAAEVIELVLSSLALTCWTAMLLRSRAEHGG